MPWAWLPVESEWDKLCLHFVKGIFPPWQCYQHLQVYIHREQLIFSQISLLIRVPDYHFIYFQ